MKVLAVSVTTRLRRVMLAAGWMAVPWMLRRQACWEATKVVGKGVDWLGRK